MSGRKKYLIINKSDTGEYYLTPMDGMTMILKGTNCHAKTVKKLNKYIKYWNKRGYYVKFEGVV